MMRLAISSALLLAAFAFLNLYSHGEAMPIHRPLAELPRELGRFQARETTIMSEEILDVLRPTDYLLRRYEAPGGDDVSLYVGYWETQRKGVQIHSPKNCLPGGGWQPLEAEVEEIPIDGGRRKLPVNRYVLQKGGALLVVGYLFLAQGEPVASEVDAKLRMVRNSILENRSDGAIIRVTALVRGNADETWNFLIDYLQTVYPVLEEYLPA